MSRHGTRHPAAKVIDKISKLTKYTSTITEKSTLCKEDIEAIKSWEFDLTKADGNMLNSRGVDDMRSLGLRLRTVYSDVFDEPYNPTTYKAIMLFFPSNGV